MKDLSLKISKWTVQKHGLRVVDSSIPVTQRPILEMFEEFGSDREWKQLMMYASVMEKIRDIPGDIAEFGVASGASLKAFVRLNNIYNEYLPHPIAKKKVFGFDSFAGLPELDPSIDLVHSGGKEKGQMKQGGYASSGTLEQLKHFISTHDNCQLVEGLFSETLEPFIKANPQVTFSLIHMDADIYKSTVEALDMCINRLNIGGIMLFDEIFHEWFPGETQGFLEVYNKCKDNITLEFKRVESMPWKWYCVRTR